MLEKILGGDAHCLELPNRQAHTHFRKPIAVNGLAFHLRYTFYGIASIVDCRNSDISSMEKNQSSWSQECRSKLHHILITLVFSVAAVQLCTLVY